MWRILLSLQLPGSTLVSFSLPREQGLGQMEQLLLEPWLCRGSLGVPGCWHCCSCPKSSGTATLLCWWCPRWHGPLGTVDGGGISCLSPGSPCCLPCPPGSVAGARAVPKGSSVPLCPLGISALGTVCGVMGPKAADGTACPVPLPGGELLASSCILWECFEMILVLLLLFWGFFRNSARALCRWVWCWLGPCDNMLFPFLCLILPSNWASFSFLK